MSAHHLAVLILPERCSRDDFRTSLAQQRVQTSVHYPPIHTFSAYDRIGSRRALPVTDALAPRLVTLPYPHMTSTDRLGRHARGACCDVTATIIIRPAPHAAGRAGTAAPHRARDRDLLGGIGRDRFFEKRWRSTTRGVLRTPSSLPATEPSSIKAEEAGPSVIRLKRMGAGRRVYPWADVEAVQ